MKKFLSAFLFFLILHSGFSENMPLEYYPWFASSSTISAVSSLPPVFISPNNDGINDNLIVPLEIRESGFLVEWRLVVENEKGKIVRTIKNKQKRDLANTFTRFWKSLGSTRRSVEVPTSVIWNGVMNSGEVAPDGVYYYYVTASDDNGNSCLTNKFTVIVDMSPPVIKIEKLSAQEKIFGEGEKNSLFIVQSGSVEEQWDAAIFDLDGKQVRTFSWKDSAPTTVEWSGTDDSGLPVKDGVYSYKISCKDKAGNIASASVPNIVFTADKPSVSINVSGNRYFSPNGDGKSDKVSFDVKISLPDAKTGNRLSKWNVSVTDKDDVVVKSFSGESNPPSRIVWDGTDEDGAVLPDGRYNACVVANYINGYETGKVKSPVIILDTRPPLVGGISYASLYNPDEAVGFEISHELFPDDGSPVKKWNVKIVYKSSGEVVFEKDYEALPEKIVWDGLTENRTMVDDGVYNYVLSAVDDAENEGKTVGSNFTVDTTATELVLSVNRNAFNSEKTAVIFTPVVRAGKNIIEHELSIMDRTTGVEVWSQKGTALPRSFTWKGTDSTGKKLPDGDYVAILTTLSTNNAEANAKSKVVTIDNAVPEITIVPEYKLFSPNGDGQKDVVPFKITSTNEKAWRGTILNSANKSVRRFSVSGSLSDFSWDGTDENGNVVPDGVYRISFETSDIAGNSARAEVTGLQVDTSDTKLFVTAEETAFSPNSDGLLDTQEFLVNMAKKDGIDNWNFSVVSEDGKVVKSWSNLDGSKTVPSSIIWDGRDDIGNVREGKFRGVLNVVYEKGDVQKKFTSLFTSSITPPDLSVEVAPEFFTPDNDGVNDDLLIKLGIDTHSVGAKSWSFKIKDPTGKDFWQASGTGAISGELLWDGRSNMGKKGELVESASDYPYEFTVTDEVGMVSTKQGVISIDLLVIDDNGVLKMRVPSIIFRSDSADFGVTGEKDEFGSIITMGLTQEQRKNNERVLKRIAETLNNFIACTVVIEGHANNVSGTAIEESEDTPEYGRALIPLSEKRAEFVMNELVRYGVEKNRLSFLGRGGTQPVVERSDVDNWWKNRRVEFILNK